jgi:hypothetical protein
MPRQDYGTADADLQDHRVASMPFFRTQVSARFPTFPNEYAYHRRFYQQNNEQNILR